MTKLKQMFEKVAILSFVLLATKLAVVSADVSQEGWSPSAIAGAAKGLPNPQGGFFDILLAVIDWALIIIGLLCVIAFIYAGFVYLTGQGETDNIERAKKILIYAIVGTAVAVLGLIAVTTIDKIMRGDSGSGGGGGGVASPAENTAGGAMGGAAPPSGAPPTGGGVASPASGTAVPTGGGAAMPVIPSTLGQ